MALFGSARDVSLIRRLNKELINEIIDTEVYYYKPVLDESLVNVYGESPDKVFYNPVKIPCLIDRQDTEQVSDDFGQSYQHTAIFNFLRDTLKDDKDVKPDVGDIIQWDNEYYMVDNVNENRLFVGKNPQTWDGGDGHGTSLSIICNAHVTRQTSIKLINVRFGNSNQQREYNLPMGI
jgi:hypothetical protein